jgi:glutathione peroxidase
MTIFDFVVKNAKGDDVDLSQYQGKVLLVVNVASQCGFTSQYESQGFEVLGFPCNQFGAQESGTDAEIQIFCDTRFGVKFPVFQKIDVNGAHAAPVFNFLKEQKKGLLRSEAIKWNFTKFLVDRDGNVRHRYGSIETPESIQADIQELLNK